MIRNMIFYATTKLNNSPAIDKCFIFKNVMNKNILIFLGKKIFNKSENVLKQNISCNYYMMYVKTV